jgi:UDP-glucose 4-epimerase
MTKAWVIGSNGLLGSALLNVLRRGEISLFIHNEYFCWDNESELSVQLEVAIKSFATFVDKENSWQIYWAAGVGTMSSAEEELVLETRVLSKLLNLVNSQSELINTTGSIAFASSAGAIYAGSADDVITENTTIAPTTAYAHEKLRQEKLLSSFANTNSKATVLLARITTLYGPGQASGKRQGLLAEIARRILRNQPIQIYVPFDTIRDYIYADDAAEKIITATHAISGKNGVFIKIIASEQPTTIAEIISIFKRITRRIPRVVTSASKLSAIYTRRIQFQSTTILANEQGISTSLLVGIAQVMAAERSAFVKPRS